MAAEISLELFFEQMLSSTVFAAKCLALHEVRYGSDRFQQRCFYSRYEATGSRDTDLISDILS